MFGSSLECNVAHVSASSVTRWHNALLKALQCSWRGRMYLLFQGFPQGKVQWSQIRWTWRPIFGFVVHTNFVPEFVAEVMLHYNRCPFHSRSQAILLCHITPLFFVRKLIISFSVYVSWHHTVGIKVTTNARFNRSILRIFVHKLSFRTK